MQRLLRGRAAQNLMFEGFHFVFGPRFSPSSAYIAYICIIILGKERSLELITELRATEDVKAMERAMNEELHKEQQERQQVLSLASLLFVFYLALFLSQLLLPYTLLIRSLHFLCHSHQPVTLCV